MLCFPGGIVRRLSSNYHFFREFFKNTLIRVFWGNEAARVHGFAERSQLADCRRLASSASEHQPRPFSPRALSRVPDSLGASVGGPRKRRMLMEACRHLGQTGLSSP